VAAAAAAATDVGEYGDPEFEEWAVTQGYDPLQAAGMQQQNTGIPTSKKAAPKF
jgi:hypothetical protein